MEANVDVHFLDSFRRSAVQRMNLLLQSAINSTWFNLLIKNWKRVLVVVAPFILMWIPITANTPEARCGYVVLLMAIFYMTEALPLAVTALIPVFAFPLLGIASTDAICRVYLGGTSMMYLGGLIVAVAVEHSNLHKRIALFVILKVGQSPRRLMGSFMLTTMFLSMWISNTAATAMMVPILDAILQEIYKNDAINKIKENSLAEIRNSEKHQSQLDLVESQPTAPPRRKSNFNELHAPGSLNSIAEGERMLPPDEESQALSTMFFLGMAYGANLGGTGFPTGSGPNIVLWGILQSSFPEGTGLNFATWMAFNVPGMLLNVAVTFIWLEILFLGVCGCRKFRASSKEKEAAVRELVEKSYKDLGSIRFHEIVVSLLFVLLVILWIFRAPQFITGWADLIQASFGTTSKIGNASPAFLVVFLLFVIPIKPPWWTPKVKGQTPAIEGQTPATVVIGQTPACLTWEAIHKKVPWDIVILMGGGFAMAEGASASGLSEWIKLQLQVLEVLPHQAIIFLVCLIATFLTEIISNVTAASILLPVLRDMAIALRLHPLSLMLPGVLCCSYAFMLPVANPPNAIAFNASTMKNSDMIKAGFILNILCVCVITGLINTLGVVLFDLNTFPAWAEGNYTLATNIISNSTTVL